MSFQLDDIPWTIKALYTVGAVVSGAIAGIFAAGMKANDILRRLAAMDSAISELKKKEETQQKHCADRWVEIEKLQEKSCGSLGELLIASLKVMIAESEARRNQDIMKLNATMAVLVEKHEAVDDLKGLLVSVLDRREINKPVVNERRSHFGMEGDSE